MPRRGAPAVVAALALALALGAAACGGSSPPSTSPAPTTTTTMSPARAKAEIAQVYTTLFNLANPSLASKMDAIQDGASLRKALAGALSSQYAKVAGGARISAVTMLPEAGCQSADLPSPCAAVVYDILGTNGAPLLAGSKGYAVEVGGRWLVAKSTICGLLAQIENGVSGC